MNPIAAAAVALVVGIVLGVLIMWISRRRPRLEPTPTFESDVPVVPAGVAEVLAILNSSGIVVGPHDEVLEATSSARTLGLVRGSRIAVPELLQLVRVVRRDQVPAYRRPADLPGLRKRRPRISRSGSRRWRTT